MVVAALEHAQVVKQAGQGVAGGERGLLIEGVRIDDRFRHHHLTPGKLDAGKTQVDLLLDALWGEGPPLVVAAILLEIAEIALQQQIDGGGHVGGEIPGLQLGQRTRLPQPQRSIVGPVNMMALDVIDPDGRMEYIHHGELAFV